MVLPGVCWRPLSIFVGPQAAHQCRSDRAVRMPAKQDQQAARERRARIHRSILDRWNDVTRPLGWAVENEPHSAKAPLQQNSCGAVGSHAEHAGNHSSETSNLVSNLAGCPPSAAVVGAGSEVEAGERGRAGEPLLSVAANVAGNLKEGLREEAMLPPFAQIDRWNKIDR